MNYQSFGEFLKAHRSKINMTQEEVAHELGKTKSAYSKYESGRDGQVANIAPDTLRKICKIIDADYTNAALLLMIDQYKNESTEDLELSQWDILRTIASTNSKVDELIGLSNEITKKMTVHENKAKKLALETSLVLEMGGLALWEQELQGVNNFWIATAEVYDNPSNPDSKLFFDAVITQLKKGSKYTFFIPENIVDIGFRIFIKGVKEALGGENPPIRAVPLNGDEAMRLVGSNAYIISNPMTIEKQTAFVISITDHSPLLAYKMKDARPIRDHMLKIANQHVKDNDQLADHITG